MKKSKTNFFRAVTAGVLALSIMPMSGCDRHKPTVEKTVNVAVIIKNQNAPYWEPVQQACDDLSAEYGEALHVSYMGPEEESVEKQIPLIEKAISDKVDAIVVAACDPNAENETLAKATAAGIPIITIDSDVSYEGRASYIGTMNDSVGKTAARYAASLLNNEGTIGIIYHGSALTAVARRDGFIEQLEKGAEPEKTLAAGAGAKQNNSVSEENTEIAPQQGDIPVAPPEEEIPPEEIPVNPYANIKVAESLNGESDWNTSKEQAVKLIKNDNVDLIFATNSKGTWGACEAVSELIESGDIQQGQVKIVGFDYFDYDGTTAKMYMDKKILDTVIVQNPYNMGYLGVRYAMALADGERIPPEVDTGAILVTSDNINDPDIQFLINN